MLYNIAVIDDQYESRKKDYETFFEEKYGETEVCFKILPIVYESELIDLLEEGTRVDAIFADARLEGFSRTHDPYPTDYLLRKFVETYKGGGIPPVFMVSKHWNDSDFLLNVSRQFSSVKEFRASAFYDFKTISGICSQARSIDEKGKPRSRDVIEERHFILREIKKSAAEKNQYKMPTVDAVVLFAVPDERDQAYKVFGMQVKDDQALSAYGLVYQIKEIDQYRIAFIIQTRMGMAAAAQTTTAAIHAFEPKIVIMAGICAGDKDKTKLGNIMIPREVFDYASGKIKTEKGKTKFLPRNTFFGIDARLKVFFSRLENSTYAGNICSELMSAYYGQSAEERDKIAIDTSPMATGPWVVDTPSVFEKIHEYKDKCTSLDMEASAVAEVCQLHMIPWLIIKAVQDFANGDKGVDENKIRSFAAFSSAMFVKNTLSDILFPLK